MMHHRENSPSPHSRRCGLTLIEVLISMFILAVGLLGAASLLPLGQRKMMEANIDRQKSHVAEIAVESLREQGGLNPSRWVTSSGANFDAAKAATAARILCRVTGSPTASAFSTDATGLSTVDGYYNNCVVEFRRGTLAGQRRLVTAYVGSTKTFQFNAATGSGYEPFPAAPYAGDTLSTDTNSNGRYEPGLGDQYTDGNSNGTYDPPDTFVVIRARPFAIDPLLVAQAGASAGNFAIGMPCVTLWSTAEASPMTTASAENLCLVSDDLLFNAAKGNNDPTGIYYSEPYNDANGNGICDPGEFTPGTQDTNNNGTFDSALRRKAKGSYSWLATIVPSVSGETQHMQVSIVVFYNRILAVSGAYGGGTPLEMTFVGSGYGGGAALSRATTTSATPQADLKPIRPGHWLLVSNAGNTDYRWYRVDSIGTTFQDAANGNRWTCNVTLTGPDWNPIAGMTANVAYYPGVVGVIERTVQLETLPDSSN